MVFRARPNGSPLTPGPVSLGRGSNQACSGDDPRLTDARESIYVDGVIVGKRRNVNFVAGTNVTLTGTDVSDTDTVDVTIDSTGGGGGGVVDGVYEDITVSGGETSIVLNSPVDPTKLGSGSANSTTYLRGDSTWASIPGVTGNSGTTTIDFGAFPGLSDAAVTVYEPSIGPTSIVQAWLVAADTADHSADEHVVETIQVIPGAAVAGAGFTIYAKNTNTVASQLSGAITVGFRAKVGDQAGFAMPSVGGEGTRIWGQWTVAWRWS